MKRTVIHMTAQGGGRILNVSSLAGFMPGPNMAVYHAGKAFALSLSEVVAEEGVRKARIGQRVVVPGFLNRIRAFGTRLLPRSIATRVAKLVLGRGRRGHAPKARP